MTDIERLQYRIGQLERAIRASPDAYMPHELTDEEIAGAPIAPWRDDNLRGPALNPVAWKSVCDDYEQRIEEWRTQKQMALNER